MVVKVVWDDWFQNWTLNEWSKGFDWDKGNIHKLEKHGMNPADVERLWDKPVSFVGKIEKTELTNWNEERFLLVGSREENREFYSMIVTTRGDLLRVISCRRSRPEEEKRYE